MTLRSSFSPLLVVCALVSLGACKVDETGLSAQTKLQRDGSAPMPDLGALPGLGGATGEAGATATGGTGGAPSASGGTGAGIGGGGTGGVSSGGTTGQAGTSGGGVTGAAGSNAAGTTGAAGMTGAAGTTGAAGMTGAAGSNAAGTTGAAGTAGTTGAAGMTGAGATGGTGGVTATGGTGGVVATGGTGGGGTTGAAGSTAPSCGPENCANGCCEGTQCVRTRSAMFCGTGGAACKACGPCELCTSSSTCDIDPSSDWTIVAVSATVDSSPPRGGNWDPKMGAIGGQDPDLFCQFEQPPHTVNTEAAGVTDTVKDVTSTTWNQVINPMGKFVKASDLMTTAKPWRIWVGDDDGCGLQGCVGETLCQIDPPLAASVLRAGQLTKENYSSCKSFVLRFLCQD